MNNLTFISAADNSNDSDPEVTRALKELELDVVTALSIEHEESDIPRSPLSGEADLAKDCSIIESEIYSLDEAQVGNFAKPLSVEPGEHVSPNVLEAAEVESHPFSDGAYHILRRKLIRSLLDARFSNPRFLF